LSMPFMRRASDTRCRASYDGDKQGTQQYDLQNMHIKRGTIVDQTRRVTMRALVLAGIGNTLRAPAEAVSGLASGSEEEGPTLRQRVEGGAISPTTYSLESPDVYYPSWFNGVWATESTTLSVEAPAGIPLFGGNRSHDIALDDVGQTIRYDTRFRLEPAPSPPPPPPPYSTVADMAVVADREYNIGSIVKATMGEQAILNVPVGQDNPNRLVFVLSPAGANGTIFRAELRVTSRRTETPFPSTVAGREAGFDVFEGARQVVTVERSAANAGGGGETGAMPKPQSKKGPPPLIKDIETTTLFTKIGDGKIEALQRTATFLVPSTNADPMKAAAIQRMGGRAVDVRTYRVVYTLKRRIGGQPQPKSNTNARDSA